MEPGLVTVAARLPSGVGRDRMKGGLPAPGNLGQLHTALFRTLLDLVAILHREGVPIVAGTDDGLGGFALHRELKLYVAAGIPAPEVVSLATLGAARIMGMHHELGSITLGKLADLILVDGDPTANISDIRRVVNVIKDGVLYHPAAIIVRWASVLAVATEAAAAGFSALPTEQASIMRKPAAGLAGLVHAPSAQVVQAQRVLHGADTVRVARPTARAASRSTARAAR